MRYATIPLRRQISRNEADFDGGCYRLPDPTDHEIEERTKSVLSIVDGLPNFSRGTAPHKRADHAAEVLIETAFDYPQLRDSLKEAVAIAAAGDEAVSGKWLVQFAREAARRVVEDENDGDL